MDSRKFSNTQEMIETLGHELSHYKQYKDGVLDQDWDDDNERWLCVWNGKHYKEATTYNQYLKLPWEVEARVGGTKARKAFTSKLRRLSKRAKLTQKA